MRIPIEVKERFHEDFHNKDFNVEDAMPYFSSYCEFDVEKARKRGLRQHTKNVIKSYSGPDKVRECLGFKKDGEWRYAFIDTVNRENMCLIHQHLSMLVKSTSKTKSKTEHIMKVLEDQMSIFEQAPKTKMKIPQRVRA